MEFRILGPIEVLDDKGNRLELGGHMQRAVLAALLLDAGRVVSTDSLTDRIWGEKAPKSATASLQNAISRLRKAIGADRVLTRSPGYLIEVDASELDLARFEGLVAGAREASAAARSEMLHQALALWRGPPLADLAFDSFAAGECARLEELRLTTLEERIEADLELGYHAGVVGEVEALVASHPLRERLRGHLMLALYRCGRQAEALEAYQDARRVLIEELGIEPSQRLRQLERSILKHEHGLDTGPEEVSLAGHLREVLHALTTGRLVIVLGSETSGGEVTSTIAGRFGYAPEEELARIAQHIVVTRGRGPLEDELHALLDADLEPERVHELVALMPAYLRRARSPQPLIVTTGYDLALERALLAAGEEFDLVSYVASGPGRGRFQHLPPAGDARIVEVANTYADVSPDERTTVLKIHGQAAPAGGPALESFVVSEDDYIDYLVESDIASVLPVTLVAKLRRSHFLFLGYTPQEWPYRVFLRRVWGGNRVLYRSWAVDVAHHALAREYWRHLDVDLVETPLADYVEQLAERIADRPRSEALR
jgi:DNA-binding SARP family transcriptional activator